MLENERIEKWNSTATSPIRRPEQNEINVYSHLMDARDDKQASGKGKSNQKSHTNISPSQHSAASPSKAQPMKSYVSNDDLIYQLKRLFQKPVGYRNNQEINAIKTILSKLDYFKDLQQNFREDILASLANLLQYKRIQPKQIIYQQGTPPLATALRFMSLSPPPHTHTHTYMATNPVPSSFHLGSGRTSRTRSSSAASSQYIVFTLQPARKLLCDMFPPTTPLPAFGGASHWLAQLSS